MLMALMRCDFSGSVDGVGRSCGEKRNFGHELLGETAGRNFWRNYGSNSGEIIAKIRGGVRKIVWEKMCFWKEFRKPLGHEVTKKLTGAGRVLAFLQRDLRGIKRELVYLRVLYLFQSLVHDCKASRGWMAMQRCRKMDQQASGFRSANPTKERPRNEFASSCFWRMPFSLHKTHFQIMPRNSQGTPRNVLP